MKTVFISVFQTFVSRNILNTGVLDELLERGNRVVLFVPKAKEEFYKITYIHPNIKIEPFDINTNLKTWDRWFRNLAELLINTNTKLFHKKQALYLSKNYIKYFFEILTTALLGQSVFIKKTFRVLEKYLNRSDCFGLYFDKYKPDVVFATDVFGISDVLLMKSAKVHKVKTVGMVLSWDNNTSKHLMRVMPEMLIVQNEIIKKESIEIQSVPAERIKLSGIPHYDYYNSYKPINREEFFNKINADVNKKLIVISPAGEKFISTDWQIFEILKKAQEEGRLDENIQFLIRVHPTNKIVWGDFVPNDHFIIEEPGVSFPGVRSKDNELDLKSLHHLLDTLYHSDLLINVLSSIIIDAAIFNKPTITIGFNGIEQKVPFERSVDLYLKEENMAKLLEVGATPVVYNPEELVNEVNKFLNNPKELEKERKILIERQCWKLDGHSSLRIANYVVNDI